MAKLQSRLTARQKASVCDYHKKTPRIKFEQIRKWAKREFKLQNAPDRSTMGRIIKQSSCYESLQLQNVGLLKAPVILFEPLEEAIATCVFQMECLKICLSDALIQKQVLRLAKMMDIPADKFKASNGWLQAFKKRHTFKQF
jgi:Tc5 transposase DNA-binding domain